MGRRSEDIPDFIDRVNDLSAYDDNQLMMELYERGTQPSDYQKFYGRCYANDESQADIEARLIRQINEDD